LILHAADFTPPIKSNALFPAALNPRTTAKDRRVVSAMHNIISNSVSFFFRQFFTKSARKVPRTSQRKCDSEAQQVPTGPHSL
jgi:hypothetical protein